MQKILIDIIDQTKIGINNFGNAMNDCFDSFATLKKSTSRQNRLNKKLNPKQKTIQAFNIDA